ncbi:MAG: DUF4384 domain-containing protein [Symploca sp. SIO3E6]|nr:DUF4384 domain-containing protein [Caldora sp. SIO3E6]
MELRGKITVLFPNDIQREIDEELDETTRVEANSSLLIPDPQKDEFVFIDDVIGRQEVLVIASQKPLAQAISRLRNLRGNQRGPFELTEPVEVIGNLIDDLSRAPRAIVRSQLVNPSTMAALSIIYEVVERS